MVVAYIRTSKRGKRDLVFAGSEEYRNGVLWGNKLEPLVSADSVCNQQPCSAIVATPNNNATE